VTPAQPSPAALRPSASRHRRRATVRARSVLLLGAILLAGAGPDVRDREAPATPVAEPAPTPAPAPTPPGGFSWFALPVLFWLPETRLGYGATGGLHFRLEGAPRTSSAFVVGAYTLNHQGSADVAGDIYLRSGTLVSSRFRLVHFPDSFYGLGPKSPADARETYTRRWAQGIMALELPVVAQKLRAGVRLDLRAEEISDLEPGGLLASGTVEGTDGFTAVGLGGSVTWDTRDRPLFPLTGSFVQAWYLHYPEELGRHRTFSVANLEGRYFLPLGADRVLGAAAFVEEAFGDPPFTLLPKLGSTRFLRGWREGRFRDRLSWAAQTELRVPLASRIVAVAFGAIGDVAPDLRSLRVDTIKVAGGGGLRYRLTPEGANIRIDLAQSRAGPEVYVLVLDAF
jgi:hypothetical protein